MAGPHVAGAVALLWSAHPEFKSDLDRTEQVLERTATAESPECDPSQRLYRYEVASTELPLDDFRGEFRIREGRPHKCTVIWTAQFAVTTGEEKKASDAVREFFRAGARAIERQYAAKPVAALRRRVRTLKRRS